MPNKKLFGGLGSCRAEKIRCFVGSGSCPTEKIGTPGGVPSEKKIRQAGGVPRDKEGKLYLCHLLWTVIDDKFAERRIHFLR